jgi:serine protease Do
MIPFLAAILVASAVPIPAEPSPYFLDESTVVPIKCKDWVGTGFYIGDGRYVTARHVVRDDNKKIVQCEMAGKEITVLQVGAIHDYAIFKAPVYLPYREIISCAGFKEGANYYAEGYAQGRPWVVTQRLIGTKTETGYMVEDNKNAKQVFGVEARGSTTEGQSGGPVKDDDGLVVGIVSAGSEGGETGQLFVSLADTPLCKTADAK